MNTLIPIGILLSVTGLLVITGVLISARLTGQRRQRLIGSEDPVIPLNLASVSDAVLVARVGGQVTYANEVAREWFALDSGDPDLWLLAQRVNPVDSFLELFAAEGQAAFSIGNRKVEATSHWIALDDTSQLILVMREEAPLPVLDREERGAGRSLQVLGEVTQAINASLVLADTLEATLSGLRRLIPYDAAQICLWDPKQELLRPVARSGPDAYVATTGDEDQTYRRDEGFPGWIIRKRQPLLVTDADKAEPPQHLARPTDPPLGSYLGVPLAVRSRFIGTLELTAAERARFNREDQALLVLLAEQAAIAIENAREYSAQAERVEELAGLQKIAEAISDLQDPRQLYAQLGQRVAELVGTEMAGVLLYDREQERLVAQRPLHGVVDAVAARYVISLKKGSPARSLWEDVSYWFSNEVADDHLVSELGLADLAEMAGVKTLALAAMTVGDERIGVLQVSNKEDGTPFTMEDIRLLQTYANQAAIIVESARLYGQEQSRVAELQGLQQIVQAMSAFANPEELFAQLTQRIAELLEVAMCGILIYEPEEEKLVARTPFHGIADEVAQTICVPVGRRGLAREVWREHELYLSNHVFSDETIDLMGLREAARTAGLQTIMLAPLSVGGRRFGLLQVSNKLDGTDFDDDDRRLVAIFAGQAAALIENARLYQDTDTTLRKRAAELRAVSRVSRELNATLELNRILEVIAAEAQSAEGARWGNLVMFDWNDERTEILSYMTFGDKLGEQSHILEKAAVRSHEPLVIEDFEKVPHYPTPVAGARSALLVPVLFEGQVVGVISLYGEKPRALGPSAAEFVQALSSQATIAVTNATRYAEQVERSELLRRRAEQMTQIFELGRAFRSDQSIENNLASVARAVAESVGFDLALIGVREDEGRSLRMMAQSGLTSTAFKKLARKAITWSIVERHFATKYQRGNAYLVPHDESAELVKALGLPPAHDEMPVGPQKAGYWQAGDVLLVQLRSSSGEQLGALVVDRPRNGLVPDHDTIELLEIFSNQAAIVVENSQLYRSVEDRAEELSRSLKSLEHSYEELDKLSQEMIRKDVELSQANELLNLRAQRLLALHRIMESVDTTRSPDDVLADIAASVVEEMDVDQCVMALPDEDAPGGLRLVAAQGRIPQGFQFEELTKTGSPFAGVLETQKALVYAPGGKGGTPAANMAKLLGAHTYVVLPMQLEPAPGLMLVGSTRPGAGFGDDDRDLFALLASQIAVEYENARLYAAVQDEAAAAASDRDRLQQLHLITTALQQTRSLSDRLAIIARGLRSVGWRRVAVMMLNAEQGIEQMATAGYSDEEESALPDTLLPGDIWARRFEDADFMSTRLGSCYFLAHDHPWVMAHGPGDRQNGRQADASLLPDAWHPTDQLYLPMYAGTDIIGVINLRDPESGKRPTVDGLRPMELFVQQAASALENTRLYQETLDLQSYTEAVVQSIQQGIAVVDASGTIESANAYLRDQYGWSEQAIGQNLFEAQPALRDLGLADDLSAVLKEGQPIERTGVEYTVADALHHLNIYLYPRYDEQREVTGAVLMLEDVTQRARLEADIAQRGQQLAALNEVSRRITSTLSVDDVVSTALGQASEVLDFDHLELWLRGRDDVRVLQLAGARGQASPDEVGRSVEIHTIPQFDQIAHDNLPLLLDDRPPSRPGSNGRSQDHLRTWMGVPMISGGIMMGIMVFEKTQSHAYTSADMQIAAAYANQVAVALENARLFEEAADRAAELHSRTQRLTLLNRISSTLGSSLDQNSILQTALDELTRTLVADQGSVYMFDYVKAIGTLVIQSPSNPDGSVEDITISLDDNAAIELLLKNKAPLPIENVATDERVTVMRDALTRRGVRSALLIPLIIGNAMIGILVIEMTEEPYRFEREQIELVQTITNQVAISVQNAQLFQETVTRQRELGILFEAGQIAAASLDMDTVVSNAAEYFVRSLDADGCTISLFDRNHNTLHAQVEHTRRDGGYVPEPEEQVRSLARRPALAKVIAEREALVLKPDSSALGAVEAAWMAERSITRLLAVPLIARDETIGLIELWQTHTGLGLGQREVRLARALAASLATAMENARLHDETEQRLGELATINEMSRALTQIISIEDLHHMLHERLDRVVHATALTMAQRDPLTGRLIFPLAMRQGQRVHLDPAEFGGNLYSVVIERQEPLLIAHDVETRLKELGVHHGEPGLKSVLALPLSSGETTGVLALEDYEREDAFDEASLRVLGPIAAQVAVSLENARLYGELEQRLSETTTLQEVSRVVNSALDLQEIFERVVRELANAFQYPLIGLYTLEKRQLVLQAHHGYSEEDAERYRRIALKSGIAGRAARSGKVQLVLNVQDDEDYIPVRDWVHSEIAVPILADEDVLGVLMVSSNIENPLDKNDLALLQTFAGQVSAAMTNAKLYAQMVALSEELEQRVEERTRELREERDRIDTLYRIAVELTSSLDLDMVLNRALELVGEAVGADSGVLLLIDPQSELLIHRASMRYDPTLPPGGKQIQLKRHEGLAGWVMDNRESLVLDDVQKDPRWVDLPGTEARRSLLGAPLIANDEVLGCIFFNSDLPAAFHKGHLRLVEAAANQVAGSINNAELYRMIRDQAERLGIMLRSQQTEAAKSQAILESVADGVMVSDQAGEIILFNAAAERVLGLRRDQVLGRPASDLSGLYGPGAEQWADVLARWRDAPSSYRGEFLSEQIDLDDRIVSVHVSPVLHGNEHLGLVSVFRDITREVMADRVKSEFVARVSHELRTPMTSIKGYADLLLLGAAGEITPEQRRFLETVKNNADRLSLLVNDLLDISRIEQGQMELDIRPVNLRELLGDLLAVFEGRKSEEGRTLAITVELPDDVPLLQADYDRVTQILTNLISNAYQYTPDDGTVTVRVVPDDTGIQIDVEDTGIGIPEEDQERVFDRFFRGESHPLVFKTSGTGLGLSIVEQLVGMHEGRIWFESEEGRGSTFSVWLPYRDVIAEPTP